MIIYILVLIITFWIFKILRNPEEGHKYILFCPVAKSADDSKLSDVVKVSKKDSIFKNTFDFINLDAGE